MGNTYSFQDVTATIRGPNGSFEVGSTAGAADEGISWDWLDDKSSLTMGAGGQGMHSLHASKAGTVTIRLLKTSPVNAMLSDLYDADTSSSAVFGQNTIIIRNIAIGDIVVATGAGQKKRPPNSAAKQGNIIEWTFNCIEVDEKMGNGSPAVV